MKRLKYLILIMLFCVNANAQSIKIKDILNHAYSKVYELPIVKDQEINYILPEYISFIDTVERYNENCSFTVMFHRNNKSFEDHLKRTKNATLLFIHFDLISNNNLEITLEISKTNAEQYFGAFRFLTFIDKRKIRLIYDIQKKIWKYDSLINLFEEPRVGQN